MARFHGCTLQAGRLRHLRRIRWPGLPRRAARLLADSCPHIEVDADPLAAPWPPADQAPFDCVADLWDVELAHAAAEEGTPCSEALAGACRPAHCLRATLRMARGRAEVWRSQLLLT